MALKYFIVDAFADQLFAGNQAGICLLDRWLEDSILQSIAAENNLAETAFIVKNGPGYDLRWFTTELEVDLCGHATLGSAFIITNFVDKNADKMTFYTKSGPLNVEKNANLYEMDFPVWQMEQVTVLPEYEAAVGARVLEAWKSRDLFLLLESEAIIRNLQPDFNAVATIPDCFGVGVMAEGESPGVDFVSRFFAPGAGVNEDPVTGSTHTALIPYWSKKLGKKVMTSKQLSRRGGSLYCEDNGDRVKISGRAQLYLQGELQIDYNS